jgi:hypothetical protein
LFNSDVSGLPMVPSPRFKLSKKKKKKKRRRRRFLDP